MITTDCNQGVFSLSRFVEFSQDYSDASIPRRDLAEVIGQILANFGHVWQIGRHLSL